MTKLYPKDIKGVRPKRMLSRELVQVRLDVAGGEPVAVATRPEARGRAVRTVLTTVRTVLTTDSPMGHQYVINVAVAIFLASLLAVFLSIVLS
jgi:hypothetical protein